MVAAANEANGERHEQHHLYRRPDRSRRRDFVVRWFGLSDSDQQPSIDGVEKETAQHGSDAALFLRNEILSFPERKRHWGRCSFRCPWVWFLGGRRKRRGLR